DGSAQSAPYPRIRSSRCRRRNQRRTEAITADRPGRKPSPYWPRSSDTSTASVQTMSTLSPTFTLARASVFCHLDVYFQPFGPVKVIDGVFGSMAVIVAVIVTCLALVPPGRTCSEPVVPLVLLTTSDSPGRFTRMTTFSSYRALTL